MFSNKLWDELCRDGDMHNGGGAFRTIVKAIGSFKRSGKKTSVRHTLERVYFMSWCNDKASNDQQVNCIMDHAQTFNAFAIHHLVKVFGKEAVHGVNNMPTFHPLGPTAFGIRKDRVRMRVHVKSLGLDLRMTYYVHSECFEVKCKPLACNARCSCSRRNLA